jgi:hypothetical protein
MKISDFEKRAIGYYKAGRAVYLCGAIGRGKSTVIENLPRRLSATLKGNYGFVLVSAPLMTPPDTIGYLVPNKVGERMESVFTEPFWFRTEEGERLDEYDGGILFIDEMDKADTDVKKILGEGMLSGRFGPHKLPKGWVVWGAGNRSEDRSGTTKEYDHLINRRMKIDVDDDIDALTDWMESNKVHPVGITFAKNHPEIVFMAPPSVQGPWCTPRSLVQCFQYLASLSEDDGETLPMDPLTMEECGGMIGPGAVAQLSAMIRLGYEMPKFQEIVTNPKKAKVPDAADAQMLVCYTLAARVDNKTIGPVMQYIERMPQEFTITFGKAAVKRDRELINTKEFGGWCSRNASLMMAITDVN